jgi:hypothetical protein
MRAPWVEYIPRLCGTALESRVSDLGDIHTLSLETCSGITDVSALGTVHTFGLSSCHGITDVNALGSVLLLLEL